jgi:hypothetical protein
LARNIAGGIFDEKREPIMKKATKMLLSAALLCTLLYLPATALAQTCTLTDGTATFRTDLAAGGTASPAARIFDTDVDDAADSQLAEWGYYFRIDGDTKETEFDAPDSFSCSGTTASHTWNDMGARGLLSAKANLTLADVGSGSTLTTDLIVANITTVSVDVQIFDYIDIEADGNSAGRPEEVRLAEVCPAGT